MSLIINLRTPYRLISRSARNVKLARYWLSIRKLVFARHFPFQFYARQHFYRNSFRNSRRRELSTLSHNEVLSLSALSRAKPGQE